MMSTPSGGDAPCVQFQGREWTGSAANLPKSLRELAHEFVAKAHEHRESPLASYLTDHAYTLSEWADAAEQLYARLDEGEFPTNAQGVALARFLRPCFRDEAHPADRGARVTRGGMGLSDDYLLVVLNDGYTGGIDREGRTST
jgi:hypothetical protein